MLASWQVFNLLAISILLMWNLQARAISSPKPTTKYWVFFTDKGTKCDSDQARLSRIAQAQLSQRAITRRLKVRSPENLIDFTDLPVCADYVAQVRALGLSPIVISKWLNAISVRATDAQIRQLAALPFVHQIQPVAVFRDKSDSLQASDLTKPRIDSPGAQNHQLDYGPSYTQNAVINVPKVHDAGVDGSGVLVAMLDTGFRYRQHEAFQKLNVVAEYDFIHQDEVTANQTNQDVSAQDSHGTATLSVIGGFMPGQLIGVAYGASFLLAKTEIYESELRIEEDNWVAGIEWAEELGADVVSSSLGYAYFDNGFSYSFDDLDGKTAVTTIAANLAVSKGVVVVNAVGNNDSKWHHNIWTPADGFDVIAVGAISADSLLAPFSCKGPTADGRIKPEVVALGVNVFAATPHYYSAKAKYAYFNGTSLSCPAVAGVCALILSAHPELTPQQVREALLNTASRATNPDSVGGYGWGVVDAYEAVTYFGEPQKKTVEVKDWKLYPPYPNPFIVSRDFYTTIEFDVNDDTAVAIKIYNILGQPVANLLKRTFLRGRKIAIWTGVDNNGRPVASGVYFCRLQIDGHHQTKRIVLFR
ncbi:hypothetical protein DRQ11_09535 [candidate division KSB1 bacterium]|nr:MAG: hypothetical protein DRQ11_09535 [candidate division KSB1 bacterium]